MGGRGGDEAHPGVVQYLGSWVRDQGPAVVVVTELCGDNLATLVRDQGPFQVLPSVPRSLLVAAILHAAAVGCTTAM